MAHWRAIHRGNCTSALLVPLEEWEQVQRIASWAGVRNRAGGEQW